MDGGGVVGGGEEQLGVRRKQERVQKGREGPGMGLSQGVGGWAGTRNRNGLEDKTGGG